MQVCKISVWLFMTKLYSYTCEKSRKSVMISVWLFMTKLYSYTQ